MNDLDINGDLYEHFKKTTTQIGKKVFDLLDTESILVIVEDNDFWYEYDRWSIIAQDANDYLTKYIKKEYGFIYLYEA
jgi:hypothetical protein